MIVVCCNDGMENNRDQDLGTILFDHLGCGSKLFDAHKSASFHRKRSSITFQHDDIDSHLWMFTSCSSHNATTIIISDY